MPKLKTKIKIYSNNEKIEYDVNSIYNEEINKLIYKEPDNTKTSYDYKNKTLTRENDELRMEYNFITGKTSRGRILIKDLNQSLEVDIRTNKIVQKDNNIQIEYEMENQKFKYIIEVI